MRRVGIVVCVLLLVVFVYNGLREGPSLLNDAQNRLQLVAGIGQLGYGVFAALGLIGWWRRRPWTVTILVAWVLCATLTAMTASIAWTEPDLRVALVAGIATVLVTAPVVWFVRKQLAVAP